MSLDGAALTFGLALAAGMTAQVVARHLRVPGIVLLLLVGILLGPDGLGWVRPATLGGGLQVIVGVSVALILFEGGLQLEIARLRNEALTIRRMITIGAVITGVAAALAGRWIMGWSWTAAVPFGTLVIVTGPTVVTPLLRRIRLNHNLQTILEAEAVLIDPIGAILAVVALEMVLAQEVSTAARGLLGIPTRLLVGMAAGLIGGAVIAAATRSRKLVPPEMESLFTLALVVALYAVSETVIADSGVMAAPVAGIVVGNGLSLKSRELREFKEQLAVLLVGLLFVLLAADVRLAEVAALGWRGVAVVALLMGVVRPAAVWASTAGSALTGRERAFIAWLGPRGIVAAAVASVFAEELSRAGVSEALELRALVFLVIAATVLIEGLGGGLVASLLGVRRPSRVGVVIAGAGPLARTLARALRRSGEEVVLVDTDPVGVATAQAGGLEALVGNVLDDATLERTDLEGRRAMVCVIPNEGVGLVLAEKVRREYRVAETAIVVRPGRLAPVAEGAERVGARILFGGELDFDRWNALAASPRVGLRRFRFVGEGDRLSAGDSGTDVLPLVLERPGRTASVLHDGIRLRRGDLVTVLAPEGPSAVFPDLEPEAEEVARGG